MSEDNYEYMMGLTSEGGMKRIYQYAVGDDVPERKKLGRVELLVEGKIGKRIRTE